MPEHGTRGMGPIAEAGESPQSKLYGSTSTRSIQNESFSISDKLSLLYIASTIISLSNSVYIVRGIAEKILGNDFQYSTQELLE